MLKKITCMLLAALMLFAACACAKKAQPDSGLKPDASSPTATPATAPTAQPVDDGPANLTTESAEGEGALSALEPSTVLLSFTGAVEAEVTAEQLKALDLYDYSESSGEDTPVFSGPLVRDVLALIGADGVSSINVLLGGGQAKQSFELANIDLETALFAVLKDGSLMHGNKSVLVCKTLDGFSYVQYIDAPLELE